MRDDQALMQERYPYLSKRIFAINPNDVIVNFIPLREALKDYVEKQDGKVGVYFEYLPSGTSIGINDKEEIKLASLSKVPIAMSILKKIERGQMSLDDMLVIEKKHLNQKFGNLWKKGEGTSISINELIRYALVESDNTAYDLLFDQLTGKEINEVYEGLDIPIGTEEEEDLYPIVSPKNYSSIFRSLYLSSFLRAEDSNYILKLLTQSKFNDKLRAGVPEEILISHKIGVFTRIDNSRNVFIDCGIIYVPERPYIICAFVQDTDEQAQKHISHISKIIYGYIAKVKGGK
ncbi:MAG: serine hydrolase [Patescibacteria group bacterium]